MTIKWFGAEPWGVICLVAPHIETPVGQACGFCDETFRADDEGIEIPPDYTPWHQDCFLRSVFGSVGHQMDQCECHGLIDTSEDGMTAREAARASVAMFRKRVMSGQLPGAEIIEQKTKLVN